jgi:hypothetical protein
MTEYQRKHTADDKSIYDAFPEEASIEKIKWSDDPTCLGWYAIKIYKP